MKDKILSLIMIIFVLLGLVMSFLNFNIRSYASEPITIYGTITAGTTYLASWWELNHRYLYTAGGIRFYCVFEPTNCCIVDP